MIYWQKNPFPHKGNTLIFFTNESTYKKDPRLQKLNTLVKGKIVKKIKEHHFEGKKDESFVVSNQIDFGLDNGEFPLIADASYVVKLCSDGHRDLARRLTIAICLVDGFRFDYFLDWWMESIEEMAADLDEDETEEDERTFAKTTFSNCNSGSGWWQDFGSRNFRCFT